MRGRIERLRRRKTREEQIILAHEKSTSSSTLFSSDDDGGRCRVLLRRSFLFLLDQLGACPQARGPAEGLPQGGQGEREARAAVLVQEPGASFFFFLRRRRFFPHSKLEGKKNSLFLPLFLSLLQPPTRSTPSKPVPRPRAPIPKGSRTPSSPRTSASSAPRRRPSSLSRPERSSPGTPRTPSSAPSPRGTPAGRWTSSPCG